MEIKEVDSGFEISFDYDYFKVQAVKNIQGARWNGGRKIWFIPAYMRGRVDQLRKKYAAKDAAQEEIQNIPEQIFKAPELPDLDIELKLLKQPFHFQEKGIAYNRINKRTIIGDQPGLGKTLQGIGTICSYGYNDAGMLALGPGLIICPSTLKLNWQKEWMEVAGRRAMILSDKTKNTWQKYYDVGMVDVFICNYESLKRFFVQPGWKKPTQGIFKVKDIPFRDNINLFKWIIVDESHKCKDGSTQQTKFVIGIAAGKELRLELTGTPLVNSPKDLISQLHIIDRLKDVVSHIPRPKDKQGRFIDESGYKRFIARYCEGRNGASNLHELNSRLTMFCYYRREKSEVLKDLPAKMRQVVLCEITNRDEYEKAENDFKKYLKEVAGCTDNDIKRKMKAEVMVRMGVLKQISAKGKITAVQDYIDDIVESGDKVVVFNWLREIGDELKGIYSNAVMIRGGMSDDEKNRSVIQFQTNNNVKVAICSIKAAGVGLTLTASSEVAFIEFPWHFADCEQCEDRTHRIGQENNVRCTYFLGDKTIDKYCYDLILRKKSIAQTVTGATDEVQEEVIDELLNLFNQR